jgi:sigma-E factor negative regulatory protein RseA
MNAVTSATPSSATPAGLEFSRLEAISALVDGELSSSALDALLKTDTAPPLSDSDWHTFHLIGDVLRNSEPVVASRLAPDFAALVCQRASREGILLAESVPLAPVVPVRGSAANDAVFRWKLVAGLASVAAVAAVGWALVAAVVPSSDGAQLALIGPPTAAPAGQDSAQTVVVQTPQGQVLRDAQLEQLLADHRQFGGMSALQMPAGFLRNATYDAAPSR